MLELKSNLLSGKNLHSELQRRDLKTNLELQRRDLKTKSEMIPFLECFEFSSREIIMNEGCPHLW